MGTVLDLWILRHAKSAWPETIAEDKRRPLAKRGKHDALAMGRWLAKQQSAPLLVVTSPAKRARGTAKRVQKALGDCPLVVDERLYDRGATSCLQAVQSLPAGVTRTLIVGHNPDLEELVQMLTGAVVPMSTGCLVHMGLASPDWRSIARGSGSLITVVDRHMAAAADETVAHLP